MTVVNFSHGALYMLGAYFGFVLIGRTGSFLVALVLAPVLVGAFGLVVERFLIRPLYGRSPDDPLLLTFGLSLVLVEVARLIWGKIGVTLDPPPALAGAVNLGFTYFPSYRLFVQIVGLTTFFAPKLAEIVVFIFMALVLLFRPSGLLGETGLME